MSPTSFVLQSAMKVDTTSIPKRSCWVESERTRRIEKTEAMRPQRVKVHRMKIKRPSESCKKPQLLETPFCVSTKYLLMWNPSKKLLWFNIYQRCRNKTIIFHIFDGYLTTAIDGYQIYELFFTQTILYICVTKFDTYLVNRKQAFFKYLQFEIFAYLGFKLLGGIIRVLAIYMRNNH